MRTKRWRTVVLVLRGLVAVGLLAGPVRASYGMCDGFEAQGSAHWYQEDVCGEWFEDCPGYCNSQWAMHECVYTGSQTKTCKLDESWPARPTYPGSCSTHTYLRWDGWQWVEDGYCDCPAEVPGAPTRVFTYSTTQNCD